MIGATTPAPSRGRPRRQGVDQSVLAAAAALLGEVGMIGFSMDLVAQRAGVSKATIYRRWPSKEQLVIDVIAHFVQPVAVPDTGDVRDDLVTYCAAMAALIGKGSRSDVLPQLIAAAAYDEGLRASLLDYTKLRRQPLLTILRRGVSNDQLGADFPVETAVDALLGAFMYRRLLAGTPVRPHQVGPIVDFVLGRA